MTSAWPIAVSSANEPQCVNPGWVWRSQTWWSPARHCSQLPHAHTNGTVTRSPGRHRATSAPTASTTPASSCPGTCGNARMSGSWPIHPCQSLRQSPLASTRTTAPCGAGSGSRNGLDGRHPPEGLVHHGAHAASLEGHNPAVDNAQIADRLDALAVLLELSEANPYTIRAYRRAADVIRDAAVPVAGLVSAGRVRQLRGIGPGIEARLRELVETGDIAELAELERELAPGWSGSAATSGSPRGARSRSRRRSTSGPPRSCARRRPPGGCGACPASARSSRRSSSTRSRATRSRGRSGR